MRTIVTAALVIALTAATGVRAEDKKADANGTWKWETDRNGTKVEQTLKLKVEGDKVTGTVGRGERETKIEEGTVKDGEVKFTVNRARDDGTKIVMKYTLKVDGDTIKGKVAVQRGEETMERDFEAKRSKD